MGIDKQSIIPLYFQLADILREQIKGKKIKPGDPLPSEKELIAKYNISRGTIRQALTQLTHEGLIERFPGKGSFVIYPKVSQDANKDMGFFSKAIEAMGKIPSARVLEITAEKTTDYARSKLKLKKDDSAIFMKRLRLVDDEPWAIENAFFIKEVGDILLKEGTESSLYRTLQEKYDYRFYKSENTLESSIADTDVAKLLGVVKGSPVMIAERTMFLVDGTVFEFSKDIYRGDRIRFAVNDLYQGSGSPAFQIRT